jgi:hypothetical protein
MQCACIILSSVAYPSLQYFFTVSHKRHDLLGGIIEHKMCVSIFSAIFVWNISHSKKSLARYYQKCIWDFMWPSHYSCQIWTKLEFSRRIFRWILKCQISWKSVQWEPSCSMRTDGRTDMTNLIVAFRNIVNAPKCSKTLPIMRVFVLFVIILYALQLSVCLMKHHGIKTRWRAEVRLHPFVCSGVHDTAVLCPRKEPGTHDRRIRTRAV